MTSVSVTLSDGKGSSIKSSRMTPETMSREVGLMVLESVQSTHFREKFSLLYSDWMAVGLSLLSSAMMFEEYRQVPQSWVEGSGMEGLVEGLSEIWLFSIEESIRGILLGLLWWWGGGFLLRGFDFLKREEWLE